MLDEIKALTAGAVRAAHHTVSLADLLDYFGLEAAIDAADHFAPHITAAFATECAEREVSTARGPYRDELEDIFQTIQEHPPTAFQTRDAKHHRGYPYAQRCGLHAAWAVASLDGERPAKAVAGWARTAKGDGAYWSELGLVESNDELRWQVARLKELLS